METEGRFVFVELVRPFKRGAHEYSAVNHWRKSSGDSDSLQPLQKPADTGRLIAARQCVKIRRLQHAVQRAR